jgi:hypothetical protein
MALLMKPTEKASEMAIYLSIFIVLMGVLSTVSLHLVRRTRLGIRQILEGKFLRNQLAVSSRAARKFYYW